MASSQPQRELQRRQLDRMFEAIPRDLLVHRPPRGWIREIRGAIGMSSAELARRLGVSRATVTQMERDETTGAITVKRLERAAEALECSLGYVLIPKTPLDDIVRARAREVASRLIGQVDQTMALEGQATSAQERARAVDDLAADLEGQGRKLWRDQP
jgi:predicted DNA-binding mobile mystery protein A